MYGDFVHEYKKVLFPSILLHVNRDSDWQQHGGTFRVTERVAVLRMQSNISERKERKTSCCLSRQGPAWGPRRAGGPGGRGRPGPGPAGGPGWWSPQYCCHWHAPTRTAGVAAKGAHLPGRRSIRISAGLPLARRHRRRGSQNAKDCHRPPARGARARGRNITTGPYTRNNVLAWPGGLGGPRAPGQPESRCNWRPGPRPGARRRAAGAAGA